MCVAQLIAQQLVETPHAACTFEGGYYVLYNGDRRFFQVGRKTREVRNKDGRCTLVTMQYDDGSQLKFEWCESRGPRYTVIEK